MKVDFTLTERQPMAAQSMKPARKFSSIPICGLRLLICVPVRDRMKAKLMTACSSLCMLPLGRSTYRRAVQVIPVR